MVQQVKVGDEILNLPDGMSDEEMGKAIDAYVVKKNYTNPPERHAPGYVKPVPVEPGNVVADYAKTIASGTGRGLAGIGDYLTTRPVDWISRNVFDYTPTGTPTPFTDIYDTLIAPAPVRGFEKTAERAETYGPAIVAPAKTALGVGGQILRNLGATELGQYAGRIGGHIGEKIGGLIGGERAEQIGRDVGGTAASVAAPTGVTSLAEKGVRAIAKPDPAKLEAYNRAGITPTMGSIGNWFSQVVEDTAGSIPVLGAKSREMRARQLQEMNQAGKDISEGVRGGPVTSDITQHNVGMKGQDAVKEALLVNRNLRSSLQQGLEDRVGGDTVARTKPAKDAATALEADPKNTAERLDLLRERVRQVERNRTQPIDAPLGQALETYRAFLENRLQDPRISGGLRSKIELDLADTLQKIDENTGTTYAATRKERSDLRGKPDNPLDKNLQKPVEDALTEAMKETAEKKGVPRTEFDEIQTKTAELYDEKDRLKQSEAQRGGVHGYNKLFSRDNAQDRRLLEILHRHAPEKIKKAIADEIELRTRGKRSAGEVEASSEARLGQIAEWWDTQKGNRDLLVQDPALRQRMDALAEVDRIEKSRPGRAVPGGNTWGVANSGTLGMGAASLAALFQKHPLTALALAAPTLGAVGARKFSDPDWTARIATPRNLADIFDPRKTALALHGHERDQRKRGPR